MDNLFKSIFKIESCIKDTIDYRIEREVYNYHIFSEKFSSIRRIFTNVYD